MKNNVVRRSLTIPVELKNKIKKISKKYSYTVENDLYIELLELGIVKFFEDTDMKNQIKILINKLDELFNRIEN